MFHIIFKCITPKKDISVHSCERDVFFYLYSYSIYRLNSSIIWNRLEEQTTRGSNFLTRSSSAMMITCLYLLNPKPVSLAVSGFLFRGNVLIAVNAHQKSHKNGCGKHRTFAIG